MIFNSLYVVRRSHTGEGVIITIPADKVSALYAADCRFKSLPGMFFFFAGNFFPCSHSVNALIMMNPLFGSCYLSCQGFLKKNTL